jgi:hypothetical protein
MPDVLIISTSTLSPGLTPIGVLDRGELGYLGSFQQEQAIAYIP